MFRPLRRQWHWLCANPRQVNRPPAAELLYTRWVTRAFVAGATGYTGRAVVPALTARQVGAFAHVRPDSRDLPGWTQRFTAAGATVDSTPWNPEAMKETLARLQPDIVFALLGTTRARGKKAAAEAPETYETIDYGLTKLLLDAAVASGRPRFVYLSAIGAGPGATTAYMKARWKAEEAIRASGLPYVIARPSFITGPDRDETRVGERVGAAVGDALLGVAGLLGARSLRDRYRSISNEALASGLVHAALDRDGDAIVLDAEDLRGPA